MKPRLAVGAAALAFPALVLAGVWAGLDRRLLACGLAALAVWRWWPQLRRQGILLLGLALAAGAWLALERADLSLKAYPICVNLGLLAVFGQSLWRPPTVIERLATLHEGPLDERGRRYTRGVTQVWCAFFVLNASLSMATALFATERVWALYNGCVSYVLMGLLFAGDWLLRRHVRGRAPAGPGQG